MRAVFIGSVSFSERLFKKVLQNEKIEVVGVVTKASSTFNNDFLSLEPLAKLKGIDCFIYDNQSKNQMDEWVIALQPDVVFCCGWSHLISSNLLAAIPQGVIGYHPAAVPLNRGRHPIIWALALGLKETASSFFIMDEGADSGDIVNQKRIRISESDTADTLYKKLNKLATTQIKEICDDLVYEKIKRKKQNHKLGNYWRKRSMIDGQIDWRMSSRSIYNLIRALTKPYPGAHFIFNANQIKVWKAKKINLKNKVNWEPGKIARVSGKRITVKTGDGFIELTHHELDQKVKTGDYLL